MSGFNDDFFDGAVHLEAARGIEVVIGADSVSKVFLVADFVGILRAEESKQRHVGYPTAGPHLGGAQVFQTGKRLRVGIGGFHKLAEFFKAHPV